MNIFLENFLNMVFPPSCASCRKSLSGAAGFEVLCPECRADIEVIASPRCTVCGIPFTSFEGPDHVCGKCIGKRPVFDSAISLFVYKGTVRKLIHRAKFHGDGYALNVLCMMAGNILKSFNFPDDTTVVPVPLHISRLRDRGFNQAVSMAGNLFPGTMVRVDILARVRNTTPQMKLSVSERHANIRGAFSVRRSVAESVAGKSVLIFDDIRTSGATAENAAKELKKAGAARVDVLTLSLAVRDRKSF